MLARVFAQKENFHQLQTQFWEILSEVLQLLTLERRCQTAVVWELLILINSTSIAPYTEHQLFRVQIFFCCKMSPLEGLFTCTWWYCSYTPLLVPYFQLIATTTSGEMLTDVGLTKRILFGNLCGIYATNFPSFPALRYS